MKQAAATARAWAETGATWWIEALGEMPEPDQALERIRQGPPSQE